MFIIGEELLATFSRRLIYWFPAIVGELCPACRQVADITVDVDRLEMAGAISLSELHKAEMLLAHNTSLYSFSSFLAL